MTDATLPALSSPPPDAVPPLSMMDCTTQEEALQPTSSMTDPSQSGGSVPGTAFCGITDPKLHCNSDVLEPPERAKLKQIPYTNDRGGSASGVQDVAFNLSNQKFLNEIPSFKTSPPSQANLCSNKAFSAKISAEETAEAQPNMCSSVEANHLQLPVLPKLDASSNSAVVVDVDLLDKLMLPADQHPASVETKEDPLSIDSSASIKSSNSLSCDEASSKDSLLTSTESKSMGSPPEADLSTSTEGKELYDGSKMERIEPEGNKTKVTLLSTAGCVKPFVMIVPDETDSGCPSDSDGLTLHNSSEERSAGRNATGEQVGICAASDTLSDINLMSTSDPAVSSNSLNICTSASASDGSRECDTSEKTVERRTSSSSVVMADVCQNVGKGIEMQGVESPQSEDAKLSGFGNVQASSFLGSSRVESLSADSHIGNQSCTKESSESSEAKPLEHMGDKRKSGCQAQGSLQCDAAENPIEVDKLCVSTSLFEPIMINKSLTTEDNICSDFEMESPSQSNFDAGNDKFESVSVVGADADEERIKKGNEALVDRDNSRSDSVADAENQGMFLENLKSDEMLSVAQSENLMDVDECQVKNPDVGSRGCNLLSVEKCIPGSTTESLQNICGDKSVGCKNLKSSCIMDLGQLPDPAREISSRNVEVGDVRGQRKASTASGGIGSDESTSVSCVTLETSQEANSTRMGCSDTSLSTNEDIKTEVPSTENSSCRREEFGCAQHSSTSLIPEPGSGANEVSLKSKSFISSGESVKPLVSQDLECGRVFESEGDVETSISGNETSRLKFKDEFCTIDGANLSNKFQLDLAKSSGSMCPNNKTLSTNELETTEEKTVAACKAAVISVTAKASISAETTGQALKIECSQSMKVECSSEDPTDVNLDQGLNASEDSDLLNTHPLAATSADLDVHEKAKMGCAASEDSTAPKQNVDSGKIFPSVLESCDAGNVVLQTVVGGVLQTLDVAALEARKKEEEDSDPRKLFAGVDDELTGGSDALSHNTAMHVLENNAGETDGIGGLVINSVVGAFGEGVDEYADGESATEADSGNKDLADISSSYHAMNKDIDAQQPVCVDMPRSKRPRLESVETEVRRPVVLRVKPVKGKSESWWDSPKLRTALAEKGTILLRLCTAEPTEEYDTPADFVGVMLECCEDTGYGAHVVDRHGGAEVFSVGADGSYHPGVYSHYGYLTRPPAGGDEDFVETEEVEECMDYENASHALDWQGSGCPSVEPSTQVASRSVDVEDNSHEITYHNEDLHDAEPYYAGRDELYFESEIEEKERQYEKHKHLVEQRRITPLRLPAHICPECNKGFSKRKQFHKHLKTHRPLLECQYCSFKSRSKKLHRNHQARHRKDDPQFSCSICPIKFVESSQFRGHMSRQHGIFYCPRCCHQAASFDERNEHMLAEHGVQIKRKLGLYTFRECDDDEDDDDNTEQQNACSMCFKKCRSRALLRIHVAQHYNVDPSQLSDGLEPLEKNCHEVNETYYDESSEGSRDCKVAYTPPSRPKKRTTESIEDDPSAKVPRLNRAEDDSHRRYVNDPEVNVLARIKPACENASYRCADCDMDMPNPMSLFMHAVVTHGFLEYDARRRAKEAELEKSPVSACTVRADERAEPMNITEEAVAKVVSGTAYRQFIPYFCRICGPETKFSKYGTYIVHMKTHRKIRQCPACSFQSRLATRVLIHQMNSHKRMFRCPRKCLQLFKTREELEIHKSEVDCKIDTR